MTQIPGLIFGEHMKEMVYQQEVETLCAENCVKDSCKELMQATCSVYRCVGICIKAESSHFEHSL